jgi:hypothetical protein
MLTRSELSRKECVYWTGNEDRKKEMGECAIQGLTPACCFSRLIRLSIVIGCIEMSDSKKLGECRIINALYEIAV